MNKNNYSQQFTVLKEQCPSKDATKDKQTPTSADLLSYKNPDEKETAQQKTP